MAAFKSIWDCDWCSLSEGSCHMERSGISGRSPDVTQVGSGRGVRKDNRLSRMLTRDSWSPGRMSANELQGVLSTWWFYGKSCGLVHGWFSDTNVNLRKLSRFLLSAFRDFPKPYFFNCFHPSKKRKLYSSVSSEIICKTCLWIDTDILMQSDGLVFIGETTRSQEFCIWKNDSITLLIIFKQH